MTNNILSQALFEAQIQDESVYSFQLLLEDRLTFIKNRYKGALDSVVDTLASTIDPSKNKKYTEWLVGRHLKGDDVLNPKVKESLSLFDKASSTAHDTNIKNHTVDSIHDVAHMVKTSPKMTPKDTLHQLYDKDGVKGYEIPNKETSINLYGITSKNPTAWCTAASSSTNAFNTHSGGKYTMHFPNGHFLQIHHDTLQAKDPSNTEIDFHADERYRPYAEHIKDFMHQTAKKEQTSLSLPEHHFGVSKEKFDDAFNRAKFGHDYIDFANHLSTQKLTDEQFRYARTQHYKNILEENPHLQDHQLDEIVSDYTKPSKDYFGTKIPSSAILGNPALKPHHVDALIDKITENEEYISRIGRVKNLQPHHIDQFINHEDALTGIISGEHKFSDEQIDHIGKHHGIAYVHDIAMHQKVPEHIRSAVVAHITDTAYTPNAIKFSKNNKFTDSELHSYINEVGGVSTEEHKVLDISGLKPEHVDSLMKHIDHHEYIDRRMISNEKLPHDFIEHLLTSKTPNGKTRYIDNSHLNAYSGRRDAKAPTALRIVKFPGRAWMNDAENLAASEFHRLKDMPEEVIKSPEHSMYLLRNLDAQPKFTKEHLHSIIDGAIQHHANGKGLLLSRKAVNNLLDHPNVNPSHIHKLMGYEPFGSDYMIKDAVDNHPRTPPSFK